MFIFIGEGQVMLPSTNSIQVVTQPISFSDQKGKVEVKPAENGKASYSETDKNGKTNTRTMTYDEAAKLIRDRFGLDAVKTFQEWSVKMQQQSAAQKQLEQSKNELSSALAQQSVLVTVPKSSMDPTTQDSANEDARLKGKKKALEDLETGGNKTSNA